jgi:transposase InsO family protein
VCWLHIASAAGSLRIPRTARVELPARFGEIESVFAVLAARVHNAVVQAASAVRTAVREALRPAPMVRGFGVDLFRSHTELVAENAMLRQQLIVAARKVKQPAFRPLERGLMVALSSMVRNWQNAILLVKPDTVLRWHREGFRLLWKRTSKATNQRQLRVSTETIELIRDMAVRNKTWGAERIRGELLKLGIRVSKRTIQRHILAVRPPGDGQHWQTFLKNHVVWACDFVQVYDIWFRPLFAFFVIDINTKEVIHVGETRTPNARWTAQQLRQITPFGEGPEFIIRDRDNKFGADFDRVARGAGIRVLKTAIQAPLMNAAMERFVGSARRECLGHIIVLSEEHLKAVLDEYVAHFNGARPHQGLDQQVPVLSHRLSSAGCGKVVALPVLGGLHHEYRRVA